MIEVVEHLHADKSHRVGLLRDGGSDDTFLDPVERLRIGVHGDDDFAGNFVAAENPGDFFAGLRFQANETIDLVALLAHDLGGGVEGNAWIALDVHYPGDLDIGGLRQRVLIAA